jgi:hypothetical protein
MMRRTPCATTRWVFRATKKVKALTTNFASLALLAALLFTGFGSASAVELNTVPAKLTPFEAEAKVQAPPSTLIFQAPPKSNLDLTIQMPPDSPWLSTDFPLVEGRTLLALNTIVPDAGLVKLQAMLPIRGIYSISVVDTINGGGSKQEMLNLQVEENPAKYINFAVLAIVLLIIGFTGGSIIGGKQQMRVGQLAPTRVEILLSSVSLVAIIAMFSLAVSAEMNIHNHHHDEELPEPPSKMSKDTKYQVELEAPEHTIVGDLTDFNLKVKEATSGKPVQDVPVKIEVMQLEENFQILAFTTSTDKNGNASWKECFFDGAPHRVSAALATAPDLKVSSPIHVEAIHPPLVRRLTGFAYMICFLVVGVWFGFRRKSPSKST